MRAHCYEHYYAKNKLLTENQTSLPPPKCVENYLQAGGACLVVRTRSVNRADLAAKTAPAAPGTPSRAGGGSLGPRVSVLQGLVPVAASRGATIAGTQLVTRSIPGTRVGSGVLAYAADGLSRPPQ